jgi:hypothetical protein
MKKSFTKVDDLVAVNNTHTTGLINWNLRELCLFDEIAEKERGQLILPPNQSGHLIKASTQLTTCFPETKLMSRLEKGTCGLDHIVWVSNLKNEGVVRGEDRAGT